MGRKKYIDQIDINLLNAMKLNPRASIAQLGDEVDLSPGPTHTRLERMRKDGFFRNDFIINYSKFGMQEKICMFELRREIIYYGIHDVYKTLADMSKRLSQAKHIHTENLELFVDEDGLLWVMIRFYPIVSEKHVYGSAAKRKDYKYELEIYGLLSSYLMKGQKYFHLEQREEVTPLLTAANRMKNEPLF